MTVPHDTSAATSRLTADVPRQVLVVDDEDLVRRILVRMLREEGFGVHEAPDGHEALEVIRAALDLFDVVVSDIVMPRVSGVELVGALATLCPDLPCILISGYAASELAELGFGPLCGVLSKPVAREVLLAEVRRCLRKRPADTG
jgi:CheY-like chemotaxis protein